MFLYANVFLSLTYFWHFLINCVLEGIETTLCAAPPGITVRTKTPFLLQSSLGLLDASLEVVVAATALTAASMIGIEQSSVLSGRTRTLTPRVNAEASSEVGMEKERLVDLTSERSVGSVVEDPEIEISKVWISTRAGSTAKYFKQSSSFLTSCKFKQWSVISLIFLISKGKIFLRTILCSIS